MNINHIQQMLLRKILEKTFIFEKRAQCKTSNNLKIHVLLDKKNIGKLFSKYEIFFLD